MTYSPILIVDDEPINLAKLRQILEPNYGLVFARNGAEALKAVAKHHPSLILLDIQMPDMDGLAFVRAVRADNAWAALPVIALTSKISERDVEIGREAGFTDYVSKGTREALLASLRQCLSNHTDQTPETLRLVA